jgi:hypothetical protein
MVSQRWRIKELSPADLIIERSLIQIPVQVPKPPTVTDFYKDFKSKNLKSKPIVLYRYKAPSIRSKKVVKYESPRFTNKIPITFIKPYQLRQSKTNSPKTRNPKNELLIENLIKNRENLYLPTLESQHTKYMSLKDRFLKRKSSLTNKGSPILGNFSENFDTEKVHWHNEPIRKWETRKLSPEPRRFFKKSSEKIPKTLQPSIQYPNIIDNLISSCELQITNWPSP